MLFDPVKQAFAEKITSYKDAIIELDNDIIFSFIYANQHVVIKVHHVIDNGSILFTKLNGVYCDEALRVIPFVLLNYFYENYSGCNFFIFYNEDETIFNSYSNLFSYMPPVSYRYNFDTFKSSKYMYRYILNHGCVKTPLTELIEYMDENL